jgi:CheY-like chemotaxis protein
MSATANTHYTVLVVDDDPDLRETLSDGLELLGNFTVVGAEDGFRGLEQCVAVHPDCMVIDVMMPELDGYQLVKALRGDPETASTPLILLTALAQDRERFLGLAAGVDQYLVKPATTEQVVAAIHEALVLSEVERRQRLYALLETSEDLAWGG